LRTVMAYGKLVACYNMLYSDLFELATNKAALPRFERHLRKITYGYLFIQNFFA